MQTHTTPTRHVALHAHAPSGALALEVRIAPLVLQTRRRDGAFEFVVALLIMSLVLIAALAYVKGAPVKPAAKPAPAATAAVTAPVAPR